MHTWGEKDFLFYILTHPSTPSLKSEGRSEDPVYISYTPFPYSLREGLGMGYEVIVRFN
jgi:hypothetical protein